jgi:hypothetical protein
MTESDATVRMGTMSVLYPAQVEDIRTLSHESHMGFSTNPQSNQQALDPANCTPTADTTAGADADSDAS